MRAVDVVQDTAGPHSAQSQPSSERTTVLILP
jgi:hypothetical protein